MATRGYDAMQDERVLRHCLLLTSVMRIMMRVSTLQTADFGHAILAIRGTNTNTKT